MFYLFLPVHPAGIIASLGPRLFGLPYPPTQLHFTAHVGAPGKRVVANISPGNPSFWLGSFPGMYYTEYLRIYM